MYIRVGGDQATRSVFTGRQYLQGMGGNAMHMFRQYGHTYFVMYLTQLLLKFDKGTYAKRLSKVYQTEFKVTPPENILELAMAMPFVMIER